MRKTLGWLTALTAGALLGSAFAGAQAAPQAPQSGMPSAGGMASAGPQKSQYDAEHRPITAGGFVKSWPIIF